MKNNFFGEDSKFKRMEVFVVLLILVLLVFAMLHMGKRYERIAEEKVPLGSGSTTLEQLEEIDKEMGWDE